jgi:hypothetical protein
MGKYYTPTIEEFHVGFEFYYNDNNKTFYRNFVKPDIFCRPDLLKKYIANNSYKVKYLDREDIESLGFTTEDNGECYNMNLGFTLVGLYPWNNDNEYKIVIETTTVFFGKIKNISELKRILKQVGLL